MNVNVGIGVSCPAFSLQPFEQILEQIAEQFTLWEIVADINHYLPKIEHIYREVVPSYDLEISIHAPLNDINIASLNPLMREYSIEQIIQTIRTASRLDISLVTVHPGHFCPTARFAPESAAEYNKRSIQRLGAEADEYGVTMALENLPMIGWTMGNTLEELLDSIEGTRIVLCLDIGHAHITGQLNEFFETGLPSATSSVAPKSLIRNVHIHDNNGRQDQHLTLGQGTIDLKEVIRKLLKFYKRNIIIESNNLVEGVESKGILINIINSL